jgi:hypothetical protein
VLVLKGLNLKEAASVRVDAAVKLSQIALEGQRAVQFEINVEAESARANGPQSIVVAAVRITDKHSNSLEFIVEPNIAEPSPD